MANPTAVESGRSTWQMDATHSSVQFSVKHMMMTTVRGRFKDVRASATVDEANPRETGRVEVEIAAASIDTGVADRDAHLRGPDFFDAEHYPTITFRSTRIEGGGKGDAGDRFKLIGELTIRDTAMEVTLDCVFQGRGKDPWGNDRVGFEASTEIDRREWGLRWNQAIESGGILVANRVKIEVEAQFTKQKDEG